MKLKPLYELFIRVSSQDQADDVTAILERFNLKRQYGESEIGRSQLMKAERKPFFENVTIVKEEDSKTLTKMLYGLWEYAIYNTMIDQAGIDNVKIGSEGESIPYEQAFKNEQENLDQFRKKNDKRRHNAAAKVEEIEEIDALYNALRRAGHKHAFCLTYIQDYEIEKISSNLELIHADLQRIADSISETKVSEFQRELIQEQQEQM